MIHSIVKFLKILETKSLDELTPYEEEAFFDSYYSNSLFKAVLYKIFSAQDIADYINRVNARDQPIDHDHQPQELDVHHQNTQAREIASQWINASIKIKKNITIKDLDECQNFYHQIIHDLPNNANLFSIKSKNQEENTQSVVIKDELAAKQLELARFVDFVFEHLKKVDDLRSQNHFIALFQAANFIRKARSLEEKSDRTQGLIQVIIDSCFAYENNSTYYKDKPYSCAKGIYERLLDYFYLYTPQAQEKHEIESSDEYTNLILDDLTYHENSIAITPFLFSHYYYGMFGEQPLDLKPAKKIKSFKNEHPDFENALLKWQQDSLNNQEKIQKITILQSKVAKLKLELENLATSSNVDDSAERNYLQDAINQYSQMLNELTKPSLTPFIGRSTTDDDYAATLLDGPLKDMIDLEEYNILNQNDYDHLVNTNYQDKVRILLEANWTHDHLIILNAILARKPVYDQNITALIDLLDEMIIDNPHKPHNSLKKLKKERTLIIKKLQHFALVTILEHNFIEHLYGYNHKEFLDVLRYALCIDIDIDIFEPEEDDEAFLTHDDLVAHYIKNTENLSLNSLNQMLTRSSICGFSQTTRAILEKSKISSYSANNNSQGLHLLVNYVANDVSMINLAIDVCDYEMIDVLLDFNSPDESPNRTPVNLNQIDSSGALYDYFESVSLRAIKKGDIKLITHILQKKPDFFRKNEHIVAGLQHALEREHIEICQYIIERSINFSNLQSHDLDLLQGGFNTHNNLIPSILSLITRYMNLELIDFLIQKGIDIKSKIFPLGTNLLQEAICWRKIRKTLRPANRNEIFTLSENQFYHFLTGLIERGVDINSQTEDSSTSLYLATRSKDHKLIKFILNLKPDLSCFNYLEHVNPLITAVKEQDYISAQLLLEHGFDPNFTDRTGQTALFMITESSINLSDPKSFNIIKLFLDYGANINHQRFDKNTFLSLAASQGHYKLVHCLLAHGADSHCQNYLGLTPLNQVAYRLANAPYSDDIQNHSTYAIKNSHNYLSRNQNQSNSSQIQLQTLNQQEQTPRLRTHTQRNLEQPMNQAHNRNSHPLQQLRQRSNISETSIEAVKQENPYLKIFYMLLEHDCNINHQDHAGKTPLMLFVEKNYLQLVKFLITKGADPLIKDSKGKTAYDYIKNYSMPAYQDMKDFLKSFHLEPTISSQRTCPLEFQKDPNAKP